MSGASHAAAHPLIPPALLRNRTFVGANLTNLLVGAALMVALVDVPIVARGIFGLSEIDGALLLARFMVAIPIGALAGGLISNRLGYRLTAVLGLATAALAFFRMSGWQADELGRRLLGLPDATLTAGSLRAWLRAGDRTCGRRHPRPCRRPRARSCQQPGGSGP